MRPKLVRITTVPISLEKLLEGQLRFMSSHYEVLGVSSDEASLRAYGEKEGVRTVCIPMTRTISPVKDLRSIYQMYRLLRKERPNIVHTHTPKAGLVGMLAALFAGVPVRLHTVAGLPLMEAKGFKRWVLARVEGLVYRCATRVYPNSQGLYDFIISQGYTPSSKMQVIGNGSSNGIDTTYFDPNYSYQITRTDLGIPEDHFVYIFVGRLVGDKGINELVAAFAELSQQHSNMSLLLVGPQEAELDPLSESTRKTITEHPGIHALGYQGDVRPYFAIADGLVFPSYREGFPNVVMQAGAMGLPIIATDINGCNEIVKKGVNGWLVPSKDTAALKEKMQQWLEQPETLAAMKQHARPMIVDRYERKQYWKLLLEEYHKYTNASDA